jgi:hypothetical protein
MSQPILVAVRSKASVCGHSLRGFEFRQGHGCLFVVRAVCCQVEVSTSSWSLVQRRPTDCGVSECDCGIEASKMRRSRPSRGCWAMKKKIIKHNFWVEPWNFLTKETLITHHKVQELFPLSTKTNTPHYIYDVSKATAIFLTWMRDLLVKIKLAPSYVRRYIRRWVSQVKVWLIRKVWANFM